MHHPLLPISELTLDQEKNIRVPETNTHLLNRLTALDGTNRNIDITEQSLIRHVAMNLQKTSPVAIELAHVLLVLLRLLLLEHRLLVQRHAHTLTSDATEVEALAPEKNVPPVLGAGARVQHVVEEELTEVLLGWFGADGVALGLQQPHLQYKLKK